MLKSIVNAVNVFYAINIHLTSFQNTETQKVNNLFYKCDIHFFKNLISRYGKYGCTNRLQEIPIMQYQFGENRQL